jgi:hypothetical protein
MGRPIVPIEPGTTFGRWTTLGYAEIRHSVYLSCRCACGNERAVRAAALRQGKSLSCGCLQRELNGRRAAAQRGERNGKWKPHVDYEAAHARVRAARGLPKTHLCDCGNTAEDWAFTGAYHTALQDHRGRHYSLNIDEYAPLCRKCHKALDMNRTHR